MATAFTQGRDHPRHVARDGGVQEGGALQKHWRVQHERAIALRALRRQPGRPSRDFAVRVASLSAAAGPHPLLSPSGHSIPSVFSAGVWRIPWRSGSGAHARPRHQRNRAEARRVPRSSLLALDEPARRGNHAFHVKTRRNAAKYGHLEVQARRGRHGSNLQVGSEPSLFTPRLLVRLALVELINLNSISQIN